MSKVLAAVTSAAAFFSGVVARMGSSIPVVGESGAPAANVSSANMTADCDVAAAALWEVCGPYLPQPPSAATPAGVGAEIAFIWGDFPVATVITFAAGAVTSLAAAALFYCCCCREKTSGDEAYVAAADTTRADERKRGCLGRKATSGRQAGAASSSLSRLLADSGTRVAEANARVAAATARTSGAAVAPGYTPLADGKAPGGRCVVS